MTFNELSRAIAILLACLALAACAIGRAPTPITLIAPQPVVADDPGWPATEIVLQVQRPLADRTRDSDRVLVRGDGSRMQVYPASAWIDNAPDLLQTLLIQALVDSGRLAGVTRSAGLREQYQLRSELRRFEAVEADGRQMRVEIEIHASLVEARSARIVASRSFHQENAVDGTALDPLVIAFEGALGGLLSDMLGWTLGEVNAAASPPARP